MKTHPLERLIPPPAVAVTAALLMWLIASLFPSPGLEIPGRVVLAGAIAAAGLTIDALALVQFLRAGTTINPMRPASASALVVRGIYRLTRNPMYLGLGLLLVGWAVYLSHPVSLLVLPGFVLYLNRFQIAPEERVLRESFGRAFDDYCRRVRRWI